MNANNSRNNFHGAQPRSETAIDIGVLWIDVIISDLRKVEKNTIKDCSQKKWTQH